MAFDGRIGGFSLIDILNLIGTGKHTGVLSVRQGESDGIIYFRKGKIYFALTTENRVPLGVRLLDAELIDKEKLQSAVNKQSQEENKQRLGEILVSEGWIDYQILVEFVQEQILDALFEIVNWENGEFYFEAGAIDEEEDIGVYMSVNEAIEESHKRLKEWEKIRKTIPSTDSFIRISLSPISKNDKIFLNPDEWRIVYFLGRGKTIEDLKKTLHLTTLSLCQSVVRMVNRGLIEVEPIGTMVESSEEIGATEDSNVTRMPMRYFNEGGTPLPIEKELPAEWVNYYKRLNQGLKKVKSNTNK